MSKSEIVYLRITHEQRQSMDRIVSSSQIGNLSDHLRKAVSEYIQRHDTAAEPAPTSPA
jgi:hypothetical protein